MTITDDVIRFDCIYQQDGEVKENYTWSGNILRYQTIVEGIRQGDDISSLEGVIIDKQIDKTEVTEYFPFRQYIADYEDKRFLFSASGFLQPYGILKFVIFSEDGVPFDYEFRYDEEDECFYGVWYAVYDTVFNDEYNGFAKLTMEPKKDLEGFQINHDIIDSEAYKNNGTMVNRLFQLKRATIQKHDTESDERFKKAKEYFRVKGKELKITFNNKDNKQE